MDLSLKERRSLFKPTQSIDGWEAVKEVREWKEKIKEQAKDLTILEQEVKKLRNKTFPTFD